MAVVFSLTMPRLSGNFEQNFKHEYNTSFGYGNTGNHSGAGDCVVVVWWQKNSGTDAWSWPWSA
jgi:hypothetical protein